MNVELVTVSDNELKYISQELEKKKRNEELLRKKRGEAMKEKEKQWREEARKQYKLNVISLT